MTTTPDRLKVLVVDDSRTAIFLATVVLKQGNYAVVTAGDGEEGVAKALEEKPDLILMDLVMPKCDGIEACRRLRGKPATRHIPIILATTRGEEENRQAGREAGCTEYITKPIDGPQLLEMINRLLASAKRKA